MMNNSGRRPAFFVEDAARRPAGDRMRQEAMGMVWKTIGKRIRQGRKTAGLTQEKLAEAAGISTAFTGHIERGTRIPSVETLYRICRALVMSMDQTIQG